MNFLFAIVLLFVTSLAMSSSPLDCNVTATGHRGFCRWRREWLEMRRAGWRAGHIPGPGLRNKGKFLYVLDRSRSAGFSSRLRSPTVRPSPGTCFTFSLLRNKRKPAAAKKEDFALKLYMVKKKEAINDARLIWSGDMIEKLTALHHTVMIPLKIKPRRGRNLPVQFVFEAVHGTSRRAFVAIDDVGLRFCGYDAKNADQTAISKITRSRSMLAARRLKASVINLQSSASSIQLPMSEDNTTYFVYPVDNLLDKGLINLTGTSQDQKHRRRNNQKQRRNKKAKKRRRKFKAIALERKLLDVGHAYSTINPTIRCDFITYTNKLQRCFNNFFSSLRNHGSSCKQHYEALEACVRASATSCVPITEIDPMKIEEVVIGALRSTLQTKKVFCEEEGAFVYPQFSLEHLPIQCSPKYLTTLQHCSVAFTKMFNLQHGDPRLCSEYSAASECQREVTAQECNFDAETLLLYGLNLQYQFSHNPFCLNNLFSKR